MNAGILILAQFFSLLNVLILDTAVLTLLGSFNKTFVERKLYSKLLPQLIYLCLFFGLYVVLVVNTHKQLSFLARSLAVFIVFGGLIKTGRIVFEICAGGTVDFVAIMDIIM